MSLIRARRRRKKQWIETRKGMPARKLLGLLAVVVAVIWYLGWRF
ncbi:MAG: hypothetical protein RJQ04_19995 [Longimicrobiales bacterium]